VIRFNATRATVRPAVYSQVELTYIDDGGKAANYSLTDKMSPTVSRVSHMSASSFVVVALSGDSLVDDIVIINVLSYCGQGVMTSARKTFCANYAVYINVARSTVRVELVSGDCTKTQ
jgi:hypothetical protein